VLYLSIEDLLYVAERAIGEPPRLRDTGLLEAAAARPQASAFGSDAYPDLHTKAAALLQSICSNTRWWMETIAWRSPVTDSGCSDSDLDCSGSDLDCSDSDFGCSGSDSASTRSWARR
jgi:hypothetical protein